MGNPVERAKVLQKVITARYNFFAMHTEMCNVELVLQANWLGQVHHPNFGAKVGSSLFSQTTTTVDPEGRFLIVAGQIDK